jgi:hypothetical protein
MTLWSMFMCFVILFLWMMLFGLLCWGLVSMKPGCRELRSLWIKRDYEAAVPGTLFAVFLIFLNIAIVGALIGVPIICWQHWDYLRQVTP